MIMKMVDWFVLHDLIELHVLLMWVRLLRKCLITLPFLTTFYRTYRFVDEDLTLYRTGWGSIQA